MCPNNNLLVAAGETEDIEAFIRESVPELYAAAVERKLTLNPVAAIYKRLSVNNAYFVSSKYEKNKTTRNSIVRVRVDEGAHGETVFNNGVLDAVYCYNPYPGLNGSETMILLKCEWFKNESTCSITELDRVSMHANRQRPVSGARAHRHRRRCASNFVEASSVVVTNVLVIRDTTSPESSRISYVVDFEKRYC
jgi:hypothetical protein